jgi:hypothetical protein
MAADSRSLEALLEQFERVHGRPLATSCPPGPGCRGATEAEELADELTPADR